ncbi:MAG TPA: ABC transporter permease [Steroidobacteraceae bacterium]|nr:ABC transporter permease [Steroidobacteraceae bacterium]
MRGYERIDRLGSLLVLAVAAALALTPFVIFKINRIVPGDPRGLLQILPSWAAIGFYAAMALIGAVAVAVRGARLRCAAAAAGIVLVWVAAGACADALTPLGNKVVRISPGAACWLSLLGLGLMFTDAVARMRLSPAARVALLVVFVGTTIFALAHGALDNLSIMREYAVNADRFAHEVRRHIALALGSLGAAVVIALPLGVLCHRLPRLRPAVLGTLNMVQTIPSIALFGILMVPLGALASAVPAAARLGISGIGAAPAVIALFLYSLLPIVANTVAGLRRVAPETVEAARGMGMTDWQVLSAVEIVLALPVILTGIRIVLVQNIGLATIAALIGGGGLGAFVFQGIGQTATDLVLLGAIPTVALAFCAAVLLDALVEVLDRAKR